MNRIILILIFILIVSSGLFFLAANLTLMEEAKQESPDSINLPKGYNIETYISGLSFPTTAIFDQNDLIVAEAGNDASAKPRILRIKPNGDILELASEGLETPVLGLLMINNKLYISHKSKVSVLESGKLTDILIGLPSEGDHQNNKLALGPDGKIYLGQGSVTNSGVVGTDNYYLGWLRGNSSIHDIPCQNINLVGQNFESRSPFGDGKKTTGAYHSYGIPANPNEIVSGDTKCNGSILRFNQDGSSLQVVAWGFRNPFGIAFDANNQLWTTSHGADVRGERNIFNDPDYLIKVAEGAWYGWPEYFDGKPVSEPRFKAEQKEQPTFLWQNHPSLFHPFLTFNSHSAINGLAFSRGGDFGFPGDAFIAEYGSLLSTQDLSSTQSGHKVIRVNIASKSISIFAENKSDTFSATNQSDRLNRPSDVLFGPDNSLYVIDWGEIHIKDTMQQIPKTGKVFRIYSNHQKPLRKNGPIIL